MLKIENVTARPQDDPSAIIKNVSINLEKNKIYVLMGPNGSGKSTLAKVIEGDPKIILTEGSLAYKKIDITPKEPNERSLMGIFISRQNPPQISGLNVFSYLKLIYGKHHKNNLSPGEFSKLLDSEMNKLQLPLHFKERYLNEGFSGGERKKMEILQMLLIDPELIVLDEIDSGVDIDSLKTILRFLKQHHKRKKSTILFITHSPEVALKINPYKMFVMKEGRIVAENGKILIERIKNEGYETL